MGMLRPTELELIYREKRSQIFFREEALSELLTRLQRLSPGEKIFIITDEHLAELHLSPLLEGLRARGLQPRFAAFPAGESYKSLETVAWLYERCLSWSDRQTPIVALGGGVTGDLAGFVASTLFRGVPWVNVPTSLLAQVDASVGGKTGFNLHQAKNSVGSFYQPEWVFIDTSYLETLAPREIRSGLAEIIKHALLADPALLLKLSRLQPGDHQALKSFVPVAVQIKAEIVQADEREAGLRMILNLGHTLGHALEMEWPLSHGEAISLGMSFALELSQECFGLRGAEPFFSLLKAWGLPWDWRAKIKAGVLERIALDKKVRAEDLIFIALSALGQPRRIKLKLEQLLKILQTFDCESLKAYEEAR